MKLLGSSPNSWQTCYWGWEQSITALRHGDLGRWSVPEAQCGSAYNPKGEVGNELTDASFHAGFPCADSGESCQDKAKAFSSNLNMNLAGHILLEPLLGLVIKGSILNIFITCYSLPNLTKSRVVVQLFSRVQLCDPMDCSTPAFPVFHQLLELAQAHVHWVGDAVQPSHSLSSPSPPAFSLS